MNIKMRINKTHFKEWDKIKWARYYDKCLVCWLTESKHKWNWKCVKCRDLQRANDPKRIETKRKARLKRNNKNMDYLLNYQKQNRLKKSILKELNKIWFEKLLNLSIKQIIDFKINWIHIKEIFNLFNEKPENWYHFYEKRFFRQFLYRIFNKTPELTSKDKLENLELLNDKQKVLVNKFFESEQNKINFKIKSFFTLEDVYFYYLNIWDYNEENPEILLIPKSVIKKETNLIYY